MVELHVFCVPAEVWNFKLNTVPVALTSKFVSAGFIRVSPHITLRVLRERLGEYLGGVTVADKFRFLKCIGKKLAVVKAKQETELELKSFAPPYIKVDLMDLSSHQVIPILQTRGLESGTWYYRLLSRIISAKMKKTAMLLGGMTKPKELLSLILQQNRTKKTRVVLGEKLDNQADENKQNHLTCPKECISAPSSPFLAFTVNPAQVPVIQAAMREEWKKKYFETKKATVSLEDTLNKLQQDLELCHQKLLLQLEARNSQKRPNKTTTSKNYTIIRIATVQHELHQLRRKLEDTKMRLLIEIKMRKQATSDLQALRAELTQKKIHSALILQSRKSGI
ncbi:hypothetical protein EK904_003368 [Melospiza melodia maxima]|nr:hypothetical protein EK904_003368 [Melospiza melodia maxima]